MISAFDNLTKATIFQNRDVLSDDYIPDEIVGRDEKKEEYMHALLPVYNGENPDNIFLYGQNGVGKTAVTHWVLTQLQQSKNLDTDLEVIHLNCEGVNTSYQLAIELTNYLIPQSEDYLPTTGYPESKVYSELFHELDALGGTAIVVLDEIDHVDNINTFLYKTTRARSYGDLVNTRLGLIGISTDTAFGENLSSDVRSSLRERVIEFPPYDAGQLEQVLRQRVNLAFYDDVVTNSSITYIAALGARNSGDARMALDLVRIAGDFARERELDLLTETLVEEAMEEYETQRSMSVLTDLPENIKLNCYAFAILEEQGIEEITSAQAYNLYGELARICGLDPVSERRARDYYTRLDDLNIIDSTTDHDETGGQYKVHVLNYTPSDVLRAIDDTIQYVGIHDDIRHLIDIE